MLSYYVKNLAADDIAFLIYNISYFCNIPTLSYSEINIIEGVPNVICRFSLAVASYFPLDNFARPYT